LAWPWPWPWLGLACRVVSHHPGDGDGVSLRNSGFYDSSDVAVSPRLLHRDI